MKDARSVFSTQQIEGLILAAIAAHGLSPRTLNQAFRQHDGQTPVALHTVFCATTITQEAALPVDVRRLGFEVLLFHDLLKLTTAAYPIALSSDARRLIEEMTYADLEQKRMFADVEEEMELIRHHRSPQCRLFTLYAKFGNLWDDADWMTPEKRRQYLDYVMDLADLVEVEQRKLSGKLRILPIVRRLCSLSPG